jgi:hypothetical protein
MTKVPKMPKMSKVKEALRSICLYKIDSIPQF